MNKCPNLEDLALFAGTELDRTTADRVQAHLAICHTCAATVAEFQSDRVILQTSPDIPDDALDAVRQRVLSSVRRPAPPIRYLWPTAIAACLALVAVLPQVRNPESDVPKLPEIRRTPLPVISTVPFPERPKKVAPRRRPSGVSNNSAALIAALDNLFEPEPPLVSAPDSPVVISMETADPNVTIILLADSTGGTE